jgi:hypothetical protein
MSLETHGSSGQDQSRDIYVRMAMKKWWQTLKEATWPDQFVAQDISDRQRTRWKLCVYNRCFALGDFTHIYDNVYPLNTEW